MSIREKFKINNCESFTTIVKDNWKIALLPADPDYLTEEFDNLLTYCNKFGLDIFAEFYLCPTSNDSTEVHISLNTMTKDEIIRLVRQYAFINDAVFMPSDEQIVLVITHDEYGILVGDNQTILSVTGRNPESHNAIFEDYIKDLNGILRHNIGKLLIAAKKYPNAFQTGSVIEICFDSSL